jgi:hypothetical protein
MHLAYTDAWRARTPQAVGLLRADPSPPSAYRQGMTTIFDRIRVRAATLPESTGRVARHSVLFVDPDGEPLANFGSQQPMQLSPAGDLADVHDQTVRIDQVHHAYTLDETTGDTILLSVVAVDAPPVP